LYGAEAGNFALKTLSTGGVFVAGGIAPRMIDSLKDGRFRDSFFDKGACARCSNRCRCRCARYELDSSAPPLSPPQSTDPSPDDSRTAEEDHRHHPLPRHRRGREGEQRPPRMPMVARRPRTSSGAAIRFNRASRAGPTANRFVLSAGHGSMLIYAMLHLAGTT